MYSASRADSVREEEYERIRLNRRLAPWRARYPGVPVEISLVHRSAGLALVKASHQAQLVVVGSHGHSRLAAALSGSPVTELLRRASCPVYLARQ
jgi:nucleotide-binding universal stress UspA family protein